MTVLSRVNCDCYLEITVMACRVAGHCVQGGELGVGVFLQARLPLPVPEQHLPAVVPLQAISLQEVVFVRYRYRR